MLDMNADAFVCSPFCFTVRQDESEVVQEEDQCDQLAHNCSLWSPTSANGTCCITQRSIAGGAPVQALIEALAADGDCSLYMPSPALHLRQAQRFAHLCCAERSFLHIPRNCFPLLYQE